MYSNCKYVVMEDDDREILYLFNNYISHKSVAQRLNGNPISAGFVHKNTRTQDLLCTGYSSSLKLQSRLEDNNLLKELFL